MTGDANKMESFQTHRVGYSKALHCAYRSTIYSISMLKVDKHSHKQYIRELSKLENLFLLLFSQPLSKSSSGFVQYRPSDSRHNECCIQHQIAGDWAPGP